MRAQAAKPGRVRALLLAASFVLTVIAFLLPARPANAVSQFPGAESATVK
jgi:hypothetical protein